MVISLYSRGLSTDEICGHLKELYGADVSKELISHITNTVHEEVSAWRNRAIEELYPSFSLMPSALKSVIRAELLIKLFIWL